MSTHYFEYLNNAVRLFQAALTLEDHPCYHFSMGKACFCLNGYVEAGLCVDRALIGNTNNSSFLMLKGNVYPIKLEKLNLFYFEVYPIEFAGLILRRFASPN